MTPQRVAPGGARIQEMRMCYRAVAPTGQFDYLLRSMMVRIPKQLNNKSIFVFFMGKIICVKVCLSGAGRPIQCFFTLRSFTVEITNGFRVYKTTNSMNDCGDANF